MIEAEIQQDGAKSAGFRADFDYSYRRSKWAEEHTCDLINQDPRFVALPYGRSRIRDGSVTNKEYSERFLDTETHGKRPDVLVFERSVYDELLQLYPNILGNLEEHADERADTIVPHALAAVEVESSVYFVRRMKKFGRPAARIWKNTPYHGIGFGAKESNAPHIFLKSSDLNRLRGWRSHFNVPIFMAQFYFDACYLLPLAKAERAISEKAIKPRIYKYSSREDLEVYRVWYTLAEEFGKLRTPARPDVVIVETTNAKVESHVIFSGGQWSVRTEATDQFLNA